jgi:hypothetical protein
MNDLTVKAVQAKWLEKLPPLRVGACCSILSAVLLVTLLVVGAAAYTLHGLAAARAAAAAALICWTGSNVALLAAWRFGRGGVNGPLWTLLFGLVFNCALPFSVGLLLSRSGGSLAEAGVFGLIVIFFQVSLLTETLLSLCLMKTAR